MGLKETKSYPERENENEFQNQNQNSCFDCKNNFSSRLALTQQHPFRNQKVSFVLLKIVKWP